MGRWRNRLLLVKTEDTYGTDPTIAAADEIETIDPQP